MMNDLEPRITDLEQTVANISQVLHALAEEIARLRADIGGPE